MKEVRLNLQRQISEL
jgi:hypothetical protein